MGHHASKSKNKNKSATTTSKLGSSSKPTKTTTSSLAKPGSAPKAASTAGTQKFTTESRALGSKDGDEGNVVGSASNGNGNGDGAQLNAREALARAAEERYKKLQDQKLGQSERLRAKAKQSKNDKGL
ncbi:hypothetical protein Cantr_06139 [Candida viswanathii]|uniref:Uncharacterized protein n=1 Tax=Candida viswanathii TaxID=5486 RepID=A0A367XX19_9ASCO|nr:hypothetical protein Cantr_06139 [Candida viswanathii]